MGKLAYIKSLGADFLLLDSLFQYDDALPFGNTMGHNVVNFTAIAPEMGTYDDFNMLISSAHQQGKYNVVSYFVVLETKH